MVAAGVRASRNPFDRLVHFAYGLLLAYPLREILIRLAGARRPLVLLFPVSGMLAQSGFFEIVEAVVAQIVSPELGAAYLGTQGDEWDAQKDMIAALSGALLCMAIVLVSAWAGWSAYFQIRENGFEWESYRLKDILLKRCHRGRLLKQA